MFQHTHVFERQMNFLWGLGQVRRFLAFENAVDVASVTIAESGPGTPAARSLGGAGCRAMWQCTHSIGSAAVKGSVPVNIS
jgi:hypothetical protein